jgi:hypothetical protein
MTTPETKTNDATTTAVFNDDEVPDRRDKLIQQQIADMNNNFNDKITQMTAAAAAASVATDAQIAQLMQLLLPDPQLPSELIPNQHVATVKVEPTIDGSRSCCQCGHTAGFKSKSACCHC